MALISRPNTYVAGATILASEVNSNETTIYDDYNGNVTNANIAAAAAIAQSKLLFASGSNGQALIYDSTAGSKSSFLDLPPYLTAAGTDTYTAGQTPALAAYRTGQAFLVKFTNANTGAATLNIDSLGAKAITKNGTTALVAADIPAGAVLLLTYDGTQFQLGYRTSPVTRSTSDVTTNETTTSTSYTDLTTSGPAVTLTPGAATDQLIIVSAACTATGGTGEANAIMSPSIAGAAAAAADSFSVSDRSGASPPTARGSAATLATSVANGSTHTAKYRASEGTARFANRRIAAFTLS